MVPAAERDVTLPRSIVIAEAWTRLGDGVQVLSNSSGRPLARTVKLILDPLVLRPTRYPQFAGNTVSGEHIPALRERILTAGPVLCATAAWFSVLKRVRRGLRIADGNPQELYFQRCYELAHLHGPPDASTAEPLATEVIEDVHRSRGDKTVDRLRSHINDPTHRGPLTRLLESVWRPLPPADPDPATAELEHFLSQREPTVLFESLVAARSGTRHASVLDSDMAAMLCGLTVHRRIRPPVLGERASKSRMPRPFDRSILERMFASFTTTFHREAMADIPTLVVEEIHRSAAPWQLSDEHSRVMMALGRLASDALADTDNARPSEHARTRLKTRWQREPYVRRALRLPTAEAAGIPADLRIEILNGQQPYLRRLWVRLHGRELRREPTGSAEVWDLLDGVLLSVIMDQRTRLRDSLLHRTVQLDEEGSV